MDVAPGIPLVPATAGELATIASLDHPSARRAHVLHGYFRPWDIKGEAWIFPLYTPFSKDPIPLAPAAYSEFEAGTTFDLSDRYHGGVGMVMIIRYLDGPAGPYDELLYIPGLFTNKEKPEEYFLTTTRIYVSTDISVANGRKEWAIPKHRAEFSFDRIANSSRVHITVSHPTKPTPEPFFSAILGESRLTPLPIPVKTSWLSWPVSRYFLDGYKACLIQPPLLSTTDLEDQASKLSVLTKTNQTVHALTGSAGKTLAFTPSASGWSRLSYIEVKRPAGGDEDKDWSGFGDGIGFPKFAVAKEGIISGKGVRLPTFSMHVASGVVVK
ncbi:uncharacterized protein JCM15063_003985 [Sporobolomyces koalae]|uniref:uncharacterized protein n=1 Tax=Sporobolomyces koalae TaxID=500713 RepID=UPI00317E735E